MSDNLTINVRMTSAARFVINGHNGTNITPSSTILFIKQVIANDEASGKCPVERQRLIFKGRILSENHKTLRDYGITSSDQTVHLVKGSAPATTTTPSPAAPPVQTAAGTGSNNANPFGASFQQMMQNQQQGSGAGGGGGFPPMMDPNQIQQEMMQNPEMMSNVMNSPMMQNIMSNPDIMRTMMESNPQMRELMESNPELRNVLDDPEIMRRSMEMMRDPNSMRNMMRNQDLAMSQIENIPGGFSALRRMYEDVQEPMMDAMAGGGGTGGTQTNSSTNSSNTGDGAAGRAMPNPWGSSNTTRSTTSTPGGSNNTPTPNQPFNPLASGGAMGGMPSGNPWATGSDSSSTAGAGLPNNFNVDQTISMLEDPMIRGMMDQMMSDPAAMQMMMNSNPMLRQLSESNPQIAAMMSNPEMMRSMMNPDNLRAMSQMQSAMQQLGTNVPGFPMPTAGTPPPSIQAGGPGMDFSSLLNQFQSASVSGGANPNNSQSTGQSVPPEQRFRMQLQSLNDMGFDDNEANIRALTQTHGNVNRAVDVLFSAPPSTNTQSSEQTDNNANSGNNEEKND